MRFQNARRIWQLLLEVFRSAVGALLGTAFCLFIWFTDGEQYGSSAVGLFLDIWQDFARSIANLFSGASKPLVMTL